MAQSTAPAPRDPFTTARDRLAQQPGLPFLAILSRSVVAAACRAIGHQWRERVYTPWITLSLFLSQVLSEDHSCDEAVDRFQKFRYDRGLPPVSTETTSYCDARIRLPEGIVWELVCRTGRSIHDRADPSWLFHGRPVKIVDGSTVSMPDTPRNQEAYPQPSSQAPGLGFPIARLLVVFSLAVGTVLEAAMGRYEGKRTSELALLRMVIDQFRPGDIVLADRFFCSYWVIAALRARGVDVVVRLHQRRRADFRCGDRVGRGDHVVLWRKPAEVPEWMSREEYEAMPPWLAIRELRVHVKDRTKRVRRLVIATTLTDARAYRGQGAGGALPGEVARGAGPEDPEIGDAYGCAADAEPGDGAQGGGGAPAGVQPDPRGHGRGGAGRGDQAEAAELQGIAAHGAGVRGVASV